MFYSNSHGFMLCAKKLITGIYSYGDSGDNESGREPLSPHTSFDSSNMACICVLRCLDRLL